MSFGRNSTKISIKPRRRYCRRRYPSRRKSLLVAQKVPYERFKRSIYWSETQAKFVKFRSSYEKTYAEYLDANRIQWMYEARKFSLGGRRYYLPDFYLPELDEYVETKGRFTKKFNAKFALVKELYPEAKITIVDSKQIMFIRKSMGIKE